VIEGSGTWSLNGKEVPVQAGDLMYSKPGDLHGIRNSGGRPMRFFVFKWRGVAPTGGDGS
jgi:mannose-6-phosphate isomerase-like protein (cupin superfamily)